MPPVLNVSLLELMRRGEEEVITYKTRLGVDHRHGILKLIAEAEGAPRLVESAPRPKTACESLVQEPAVGEHVKGLVRCFHLDRPQRVFPILPYRFERIARGSRSPEPTHQVPSVI